MDEVIGLSQRTMEFLRDYQIRPRSQIVTGLCIEEMAGNIVQYGFVDDKPHFIDIRIMVKAEDIVIRIRDNCMKFDPMTKYRIFYPEDPCTNVGIRMIVNMTEEFYYVNVLKLNNLIFRISR